MNRRNLLASSLSAATVVPFLLIPVRGASSLNLVPTVDATTGLPLIMLPPNFAYRTFSWTGDLMADQTAMPSRHDGMCLVPGREKAETYLIRNHENFEGDRVGSSSTPVYDSFVFPATNQDSPKLEIAGGVTADLLVEGQYRKSTPLLAGTLINCAGGVTPWGSWLTCEEIVMRTSKNVKPPFDAMKDHGYVFEVPAPHVSAATASPIKEMGLFRHEATAIDPDTGVVYLTEDNGPNSGLYRFVPEDRTPHVGSLANGGKLEMLKVKGVANANLRDATRTQRFEVEWVEIADPDRSPENFVSPSEGVPAILGTGKSGPFLQGEAAGAAIFGRGEGIWYFDRSVFFVDTSGGPAGLGSLWQLKLDTNQLTAHFVSESEMESDAIDNVTVSPSGMVACEDGGGVATSQGEIRRGTRLLMINDNGKAIPLAENLINLSTPIDGKPAIEARDYRTSEWAGAVFSPDGGTLYANIQTPGITFAITGPWAELM